MPFDNPQPPKPEHPVLTRLRKGRERLSDPNRWVKGHLVTNPGKSMWRMCMLGSITLTDQGVNYDGLAEQNVSQQATNIMHRGLRRYITRHHPAMLNVFGGEPSVPNFNDHGATTHADLLRVFDYTIQWAETCLQDPATTRELLLVR